MKISGRLTIRVQPRAARTEVVGRYGDSIKLRVAAPPVDGAANDVVVRFVAERLGDPRSAVTITAGATGRTKTIEVRGIEADAVRAALLRDLEAESGG